MYINNKPKGIMLVFNMFVTYNNYNKSTNIMSFIIIVYQ